MNLEQAFQIVAQAAQSAALPYQAHIQVQEALKLLAEKIQEQKPAS